MGDNSSVNFEKNKDDFIQKAMNELSLVEGEIINTFRLQNEKAADRERRKIYNRTVSGLMLLAEKLHFDLNQRTIILNHLNDIVNYRLSQMAHFIRDIKAEEGLRTAALLSQKLSAEITWQVSHHLKDFLLRLHMDFTHTNFFIDLDTSHQVVQNFTDNIFDINEYFRNKFDLNEDFSILNMLDVKEIQDTIYTINQGGDPKQAQERLSQISDKITQRFEEAQEKLAPKGPEANVALKAGFNAVKKCFSDLFSKGKVDALPENNIFYNKERNLRKEFAEKRAMLFRARALKKSPVVPTSSARERRIALTHALDRHRLKTRARHGQATSENEPSPPSRTRR